MEDLELISLLYLESQNNQKQQETSNHKSLIVSMF